MALAITLAILVSFTTTPLGAQDRGESWRPGEGPSVAWTQPLGAAELSWTRQELRRLRQRGLGPEVVAWSRDGWSSDWSLVESHALRDGTLFARLVRPMRAYMLPGPYMRQLRIRPASMNVRVGLSRTTVDAVEEWRVIDTVGPSQSRTSGSGWFDLAGGDLLVESVGDHLSFLRWGAAPGSASAVDMSRLGQIDLHRLARIEQDRLVVASGSFQRRQNCFCDAHELFVRDVNDGPRAFLIDPVEGLLDRAHVSLLVTNPCRYDGAVMRATGQGVELAVVLPFEPCESLGVQLVDISERPRFAGQGVLIHASDRGRGVVRLDVHRVGDVLQGAMIVHEESDSYSELRAIEADLIGRSGPFLVQAGEALARCRPQDKLTFEVPHLREVRPTQQGFELRFTDRLDPSIIEERGRFSVADRLVHWGGVDDLEEGTVEYWDYENHIGWRETRFPLEELWIESVVLSADRRTLHLAVPDLVAGRVVRIEADVSPRGGTRRTCWYTLKHKPDS